MDRRTKMEERRRKILLNAGARLEKITGRPSDIDITEEIITNSSQRNGRVLNGSCNYETRSRLNRAYATEVDTVTMSNQSSQQSSFSRVQEKKTEGKKIEETDSFLNGHVLDCILFLLFGIAIRCTIEQIADVFPFAMFTPFLTLAIPRITYSPWYNETLEGVLQRIFMFFGVFKGAIKTIAFIRTFLKFFSLYLFSFVLTHVYLQTLIEETASNSSTNVLNT